MLTFSNSGLFYRFLTFMPNQYEPNSICELFWRIVANTILVLVGLLFTALYVWGVYGWFAGVFLGGEEARFHLFISTVSALLTAVGIVLFIMHWHGKRINAKRKAWLNENPNMNWWDYNELSKHKRKVRKSKFKPFLNKIIYGFEVVVDVSAGLYERIHDKTCVMVRFTDTKKS